jgi:hypothetical protein
MATGRPTKYSDTVAQAFCARIAQGQSLRTICRDDEMPSTQTVFNWFGKHAGFVEQYARAKTAAADAMAEDILDIADDGTNDWMETRDKDGENIGWKVNGEHVQRSKLRVDSRKWLMSKLAPKKYGEKIQTELSGAVELTEIKRTLVDPKAE